MAIAILRVAQNNESEIVPGNENLSIIFKLIKIANMHLPGIYVSLRERKGFSANYSASRPLDFSAC